MSIKIGDVVCYFTNKTPDIGDLYVVIDIKPDDFFDWNNMYLRRRYPFSSELNPTWHQSEGSLRLSSVQEAVLHTLKK